jgi:hypothetical protein
VCGGWLCCVCEVVAAAVVMSTCGGGKLSQGCAVDRVEVEVVISVDISGAWRSAAGVSDALTPRIHRRERAGARCSARVRDRREGPVLALRPGGVNTHHHTPWHHQPLAGPCPQRVPPVPPPTAAGATRTTQSLCTAHAWPTVLASNI